MTDDDTAIKVEHASKKFAEPPSYETPGSAVTASINKISAYNEPRCTEG